MTCAEFYILHLLSSTLMYNHDMTDMEVQTVFSLFQSNKQLSEHTQIHILILPEKYLHNSHSL